MMWFKKRLNEKSTWFGLASVAAGLGSLAKINEAPAVSDALSSVGNAIAGGASPETALTMGALGLVSFFMKEKG